MEKNSKPSLELCFELRKNHRLIEMMVIKKFLVLKTQFDFVGKRLSSKSLYGNMVGIVASIWVFVCSFFLAFRFISRHLLRYQPDNQGNQNPVAIDSKKSWVSTIDVFREEEPCFDYPNSKSDDQNREETEKFGCEGQNREETQKFGLVETVSAVSADLYEFRPCKDINGYMEAPKSMSFIVQELYVGRSNSSTYDTQVLDKEKTETTHREKTEAKTEAVVDQEETEAKAEAVDEEEETEAKAEAVDEEEETEAKTEAADDQEKAEDLTKSVCIGEVVEKTEEHTFDSFSFGKYLVDEGELSGRVEHPENTSLGKQDPSDEAQSVVENCAIVSDSKAESATSRKDDDIGSITYELVVGRNVTEGLQPQSLLVIKADDQKLKMNIEEFQWHEFRIPNGKEAVFSEEHDDASSEDEYIELSDPQMQNSSALEKEVEDQHEHKDDLVQDDEANPEIHTAQSEEEMGLQERKLGSNRDDEEEEELPWEHDDIIEQLRMEIRNVRSRRLPTILEEESECTKMEAENLKLKPLMIDEKLEFKDQMAEIQKVYKSYVEKMRKLDILNNQTMHAIGFLQLKDQVSKSIKIQNSSSVPIVKSLLTQNLWRCKAQRQLTADDPMPKFVGDLHKDLELVYVGQVCLSWEILHWQHTKARELQQYDHAQGPNHHYNVVATEFQLFQVLLQRFIEDDPFQGPRVQHYVRNRCVLRGLLQVPSIRDDRMNDKKHETRGEEDSIISSGMLVKIIEESMRIFWKFLRMDERNSILKGLQEAQVDRKDLELLMDIRKDLQKKEKKLKDIQRSGNCVVKKFQKHQVEDRLEQALLVAQVELRLISRVLNMSKLKTEQLVWCHEKLGKINFVHRRVHMEPSFSLNPC